MANPEKYLGNSFFDRLIGGHREWLRRFNNRHRIAWDNLFTRDNTEAALCEAATRDVLEGYGVDVEPYSVAGNDRNPDFRCLKNGQEFYVDATCIMKETATRNSGLDDILKDGEARCFALLTKAHFRKADSKTTQFLNLNKPALVVVGTWHFSAGQLCFDKRSAEEILTGTSYIAMNIDPKKGQAIGNSYEATKLEGSPFLERHRIISAAPPIKTVRETISAILLCPFGTRPTDIFGVLHPEPYYPFDRMLLPKIKFCQLEEGWKNGKFKVKWV